MGRSRAIRGLSVHKHDSKVDCPFLADFLLHQIEPSEEDVLLKSSDAHAAYVAYVSSCTSDKTQNDIAGSYIRFCRQFKAAVILSAKEPGKHQFVHSNCKGARGYFGMKLKPYIIKEAAKDPKGGLTDDHLAGRVNYSQRVKVCFINKKVGKGLFTTDNFCENEVVVEYFGEEIQQEEKERRKQRYDQEGLSVTMLDVQGGTFFDGYRHMGRQVTVETNLGAAMNHLKGTKANCKLIFQRHQGVLRVFAVSRTQISKSTQLVWDYGDRRKDSELQQYSEAVFE